MKQDKFKFDKLRVIGTNFGHEGEEPKCPKSLEKYKGHEYGKPATTAKDSMVPVDTTMHDVQRSFDTATATKTLLKHKGIDWNMFGYVTVVRKKNGEMKLLDGQHRCQMVKWMLPEQTHVPAHIIDVEDVQFDNLTADEYSSFLFARRNGSASKRLTPEELLWAEIHCRDLDALRTARVLDMADLSCGQYNKHLNDYKVKRPIFERSYNYSIEGTVAAVNLIKEAFPMHKTIDGQILCGLARLFSIKKDGKFVYEDYMNENKLSGQAFKNWFVNIIGRSGCGPKGLHYDNLKNNNAANAWEIAVAYGIAQQFANSLMEDRYLAKPIGPAHKLWNSKPNNNDDE